MGTGVHDFFHEPAKGFFASPEAFVTGVRKGIENYFLKKNKRNEQCKNQNNLCVV